MKTVIKPVTIPYLIQFDGRRKMAMTNKDGVEENISPIGVWFCCRARIDRKMYVVFFDKKTIKTVYVAMEKHFLNYLFQFHITIGDSVIEYRRVLKNFDNKLYTFKL